MAEPDAPIAEWIAKLGDQDPAVGAAAEDELLALGEAAVEPLLEASLSTDPQTRYRAAWTLGQIGDPRAYTRLVELTHDPESGVAYDATIALGWLGAQGDARAIAHLIEMLGNHVLSHDGCVLSGLGVVGQPAAPLVAEVLRTGDVDARVDAAYALSGMGAQAVEFLVLATIDPDERVREAAVDALGTFSRDERALAAVQGRLQDASDTVRHLARAVLAQMRADAERD